MTDTISNDVFNKYLEIKQDIVNNLKDVFNKSHTYTHKYRGNIVTDVNVALDYGSNNEKIIQIFVRHKHIYIKDVLTFKSGEHYESSIKTNIES